MKIDVITGFVAGVVIAAMLFWVVMWTKSRIPDKSPGNVINFNEQVERPVGKWYIKEKRFEGNSCRAIEILLNRVNELQTK